MFRTLLKVSILKLDLVTHRYFKISILDPEFAVQNQIEKGLPLLRPHYSEMHIRWRLAAKKTDR